MSKVISPLLSLEARNQLGKTLVYKNRKGVNLVTAYSKPTGSPSAAQIAGRTRYRSFAREWEYLYQARKNALTASTEEAKRISNFHQFMHNNLQSSRSAQFLFLDKTVALWHINEGEGTAAYDATGNHLDGLILDGTWVKEDNGPVLQMDPDTGCIYIGVHDELNLTEEFTIKTRIKFEDHLKEEFLFGKAGINLAAMQYGMSVTAAGRVKVVIDGSSWLTLTEPDHNVWTELIIVVKAGEYKKLYLNKVLVQETTQGVIDPTDHPLHLGSRPGPDPRPYDCFSGRFDEVAIYNRILTATEM